MGRYTGRERRQRALYRLAIVVWIIVLALYRRPPEGEENT